MSHVARESYADFPMPFAVIAPTLPPMITKQSVRISIAGQTHTIDASAVNLASTVLRWMSDPQNSSWI